MTLMARSDRAAAWMGEGEREACAGVCAEGERGEERARATEKEQVGMARARFDSTLPLSREGGDARELAGPSWHASPGAPRTAAGTRVGETEDGGDGWKENHLAPC